jgi:hypothetical protein
MFTLFLSFLGALRSCFQTRAALQSVILAFRHQINVLRRSQRGRVRLWEVGRLLWAGLLHLWSDWRSALVIVSTWIARCSGPVRISKTSCSISEHTSAIIARILDCKGGHRTMTRLCRDESPISVPMNGKVTVEASITRPHGCLILQRLVPPVVSGGHRKTAIPMKAVAV